MMYFGVIACAFIDGDCVLQLVRLLKECADDVIVAPPVHSQTEIAPGKYYAQVSIATHASHHNTHPS